MEATRCGSVLRHRTSVKEHTSPRCGLEVAHEKSDTPPLHVRGPGRRLAAMAEVFSRRCPSSEPSARCRRTRRSTTRLAALPKLIVSTVARATVGGPRRAAELRAIHDGDQLGKKIEEVFVPDARAAHAVEGPAPFTPPAGAGRALPVEIEFTGGRDRAETRSPSTTSGLGRTARATSPTRTPERFLAASREALEGVAGLRASGARSALARAQGDEAGGG